jgi:hypothetical protein
MITKKVPQHRTHVPIVLPMYLGDYVQESVHGNDPVTSTYDHNCAKKNAIIT